MDPPVGLDLVAHRGSTYSRMSRLPPEKVDPHLLGYGSLTRGPDGWSAGPVTSLGLGLGLGARVWCWVQTRLQVRAALLTKSVYGAMQAMGVHLFRGESTGPRIGGPPRSTCPRMWTGGPPVLGVHCSSDTGSTSNSTSRRAQT